MIFNIGWSVHRAELPTDSSMFLQKITDSNDWKFSGNDKV